MFVIVGHDRSVSFKVSDIACEILTGTGHARPAPCMPRAKWVNLPDPAAWDDEELSGHLTIAHQIVSAKLTKKDRTSPGV